MRAQKPLLVLCCLLNMALLTLASCRGGPCERVRADRLSFEQEMQKQNENPSHQLEALIPLAMVQNQLNQAFLQFKGVGFQFQTLGQVGSFLGAFQIAPERLSLFTKDGKLMVATDFTVKDDSKKSLFTVGVQGVIHHQLDNNQVSFSMTPEGFRFLGMTINDKAVSKLVAHFRAQIPGSIAAFLPEHLIIQAADLALGEFQRIWDRHVADKVAQGVAQHATFKITLPQLPFSGFKITTVGNALAVQLTTSISQNATLAPLKDIHLSDHEINIRMAGGLLADIGNQAIKDGLIPGHYNLEGQADPEGPFTPALRWTDAPRPFQLILWAQGDLCARVQLSAAPKVALVHENAVISVEDNNIEEVWGPWWFEAGVHAFDVWQKTAEQSTAHALNFAMLQNQIPVALTPQTLAFTSEGIVATLQLK
jgi:hypothetical protein